MTDGRPLPRSWSGTYNNSHETDILISYGLDYHRIQVKTVEAAAEDYQIEHHWKDGDVDVEIYFARNTNWGYLMPVFT